MAATGKQVGESSPLTDPLVVSTTQAPMIASFFRRARGTPSVSFSDHLIASPRVSRATQHGQTMLLDLAGGAYYTLNESGAFIWDMLKQGTTLGEIVDALEARYDAPREQIAADATTMTTELVAASLVQLERAQR